MHLLLLLLCHPTMRSVLKQTKEQKVSEERQYHMYVRRIKTDKRLMKTTTNIPPFHPPKNDHSPPKKHLLKYQKPAAHRNGRSIPW